MACHRKLCSIRDGCDLHPLGDSTGSPGIGLHRIHAAALNQVREGVLGVFIFPACNPNLQFFCYLRVAGMVIRDKSGSSYQ